MLDIEVGLNVTYDFYWDIYLCTGWASDGLVYLVFVRVGERSKFWWMALTCHSIQTYISTSAPGQITKEKYGNLNFVNTV